MAPRGFGALPTLAPGVRHTERVAVQSPPELLALHAVRIMGMSDVAGIGRRFDLDADLVEELMLDDEACGWVQRVGFQDQVGWGLTISGRVENERRLAAELDACGQRGEIEAAHRDFAALNAAFLKAMTNWQIRPTSWDAMAENDHGDWRWDERVLDSLASLRRRVEPIAVRLAEALARFDGYGARLDDALQQVDHGRRQYVDGVGIDSCHVVWFELHEDLLATLGIDRSAADRRV